MTVTITTEHLINFDKNFPPFENSRFNLDFYSFFATMSNSSYSTNSISLTETNECEDAFTLLKVVRHFKCPRLSLVISHYFFASRQYQ